MSEEKSCIKCLGEKRPATALGIIAATLLIISNIMFGWKIESYFGSDILYLFAIYYIAIFGAILLTGYLSVRGLADYCNIKKMPGANSPFGYKKNDNLWGSGITIVVCFLLIVLVSQNFVPNYDYWINRAMGTWKSIEIKEGINGTKIETLQKIGPATYFATPSSSTKQMIHYQNGTSLEWVASDWETARTVIDDDTPDIKKYGKLAYDRHLAYFVYRSVDFELRIDEIYKENNMIYKGWIMVEKYGKDISELTCKEFKGYYELIAKTTMDYNDGVPSDKSVKLENIKSLRPECMLTEPVSGKVIWAYEWDVHD